MTPAEKQEVIWMFLDQGLSYKEIAERTGIPYGTDICMQNGSESMMRQI